MPISRLPEDTSGKIENRLETFDLRRREQRCLEKLKVGCMQEASARIMLDEKGDRPFIRI